MPWPPWGCDTVDGSHQRHRDLPKMRLDFRGNGDIVNFRCWLTSEVPAIPIDFRSYPNSRHSSAEVRFRPDFVGSTPRYGLSGGRCRWSERDPERTLRR